MRHTPIILSILFTVLLASCAKQQNAWDENTKPVRLEMRLVIADADDGSLILGTDVLLDNSDIDKASVELDFKSKPSIMIQMTDEGARRFADITAQNVDQRIAIVVDGQIFAAPMVREPIRGGRAQVTLPKETTAQDAAALTAGILKYNSISNNATE
jgi:preprotein translocase subunit SecD